MDKPTRAELLFGLCVFNKTLFLRQYWTDDLPAGALPTSRQVMMFMDTSPQEAVVSGRKVLKSTFIESLLIGEGLRHRAGTRKDALFVTPAENHMGPMLLRVEFKIQHTPLFAALLDRWTHDDNILRWKTGYWWIFRIEGIDGSGRNMVGLKAHLIILDEASFGAWKAHDARIQAAVDPVLTKWLYAGVPNGVRLTPFWSIDQNPEFGKDWSIHRFTSFENPVMNAPEARERLKAAYKDENEYLNNVLGQWGEERSSSFPSEHVAASQGRDQPYATLTVTDTDYQAALRAEGTPRAAWGALLSRLAAVASLVGERADLAVLGSDFGYSPDPTEGLVAYRDALYTARGNTECWRVLCRLTLRRITAAQQAECVDVLRCDILQPRLGGPLAHITADMQGYGNAVFADFLFTDPRYDTAWYRSHCTAAAFGSTESTRDAYDQPETDRDGKVVKRRRKQTSTELLKDLFAANLGLESAVSFLA